MRLHKAIKLLTKGHYVKLPHIGFIRLVKPEYSNFYWFEDLNKNLYDTITIDANDILNFNWEVYENLESKH